MRFRIEVTLEMPRGYGVRVTTEGGGPLLDADGQPLQRQPLGVVGDPPAISYPLPPSKESEAIPAADPHQPLCTATATTALDQLLERFILRSVRGNDLEALGRYLFTTLIGDAAWAAIESAAKTEWIDLVLVFQPEDVAITRLPWELMRNGQGFLAALPQVSLVREVAGTSRKLEAIARAPRVLFVVGTELHRDVVRPGAEYLQLVRALRARQLPLKTHLVCRASPERVAAAVEEFRPDAVHFICHGAIDARDQPYLELVDSADASKTRPAYGDAIQQMLHGSKGNRPLPRLVVLSACYSGSAQMSRIGQVATPLAAQLVGKGVPVVVAMAGPVADQACRLFTRQFYESVATQDDLARATALGRRAAIRSGGVDPATGVDWVFPTIFVAGELGEPSLKVELSPDDAARLQRWSGLLTSGTVASRPLFCDRLSVFERFDLLMADAPTQQALTGNARTINALAVDVAAKDDPQEQFGRTWLLRELAAKACADGHLPILATRPGGLAPKTLHELIDDIIANTEEVLLALDHGALRFDLVAALRDTPPGQPLPPTVVAPPEITPDLGKRDDRLYARALRYDLLRLLDVVQASCRPADEASQCRLVLLLDDLHRMGEGAAALLQTIWKFGLAPAAARIRMVVTWASMAIVGQEDAVKVVEEWVKDQPPEGKVSIERFGKEARAVPAPGEMPVEERLAYEHFLLHRDAPRLGWKGLAMRPIPDALAAQMFWHTMTTQWVKGVPSRLENGMVSALDAPDAVLKAVFQPADDEHWLTQVKDERR
jgi:hypothetical protein